MQRFKITLHFSNGQTNTYNGAKRDLREHLKFLGTVYKKIIIEEIK